MALETAANPLELEQRAPHRRFRYPQFLGHSQRRERIEHAMPARQIESDRQWRRALRQMGGEAGLQSVRGEISGADIAIIAEAVSEHRAA